MQELKLKEQIYYYIKTKYKSFSFIIKKKKLKSNYKHKISVKFLENGLIELCFHFIYFLCFINLIHVLIILINLFL